MYKTGTLLFITITICKMQTLSSCTHDLVLKWELSRLSYKYKTHTGLPDCVQIILKDKTILIDINKWSTDWTIDIRTVQNIKKHIKWFTSHNKVCTGYLKMIFIYKFINLQVAFIYTKFVFRA